MSTAVAAPLSSLSLDDVPTRLPASGPLTFESFSLPSRNQRQLEAPHPSGSVLPLALRPSSDNVTLDAAIQSVRALQNNDKLLSKLLARNGALLFRGLPITNADEFSQFAHAFGFKPHEIIGIVVDRPLLAPNVAPANEAPKEVLIYNHNESPQVPHAPEYIIFYGHRTPKSGGETPLSSSLELFARAQREIPDFIDAVVSKGILSTVTYKFDKQYAGGSTLKQAFGKEIEEGDDEATQHRKIEAQIARYARGPYTTWKWNEDGITLTHRLPVVRTQPGTNLPTLFTGLAAYYKRTLSGDARAATANQLYGDGTPISNDHLAALVRITDDIRVLHTWQQGDVLVYDNIIAQHGREPWQGAQEDRVVLASLWDGDQQPGAYGFGAWAQVVQALEG